MNKYDNVSEEVELNEDIKKLVIARIDARISSNLKLSIGDKGSLNKQEMIEHVKKGDEIGKQIAKVHLSFIKAQASGELITTLNSL